MAEGRLPGMSEEGANPEYQPFSGDAEFQLAVDRLLTQHGRELRIFETDGKALKLNSPERLALLEAFLRGSRTRRIQLALHDTEHIVRHCPRMMHFLRLFNHVVQINRTHEEIRNLQDAFMVLDAQHYVRRPLASSTRGAIGLYDENEAQTMRSRFLEIWTASYPGVSSTTAGL
jgi:hypothetical protein